MIPGVWNNNFAYGVGLITADGCLSPDKRHIEFSSKDIELVDNIKKSFKLKNKICRKRRGTFPRTKCYRVQFGDVGFYNFLIKIGLCSCKSHKLGTLRIPKQFFADFLRGVIDGDGSIDYYMHPESKEKQFRIRISSASKSFLEWLKKEIDKGLKIKGIIRHTTKAYELCYYKKASVRIVNFVYYSKSILFLKRKFKLASLLFSEGGGTGIRASLRS